MATNTRSSDGVQPQSLHEDRHPLLCTACSALISCWAARQRLWQPWSDSRTVKRLTWNLVKARMIAFFTCRKLIVRLSETGWILPSEYKFCLTFPFGTLLLKSFIRTTVTTAGLVLALTSSFLFLLLGQHNTFSWWIKRLHRVLLVGRWAWHAWGWKIGS